MKYTDSDNPDWVYNREYSCNWIKDECIECWLYIDGKMNCDIKGNYNKGSGCPGKVVDGYG